MKKNKLIPFLFFWFIFFGVKDHCSASTSVIVLIDSRLFEDPNNNIDDFESSKSIICQLLITTLYKYSSPYNSYSAYTFLPGNGNFQFAKIITPQKLQLFDLNDPAKYSPPSGGSFCNSLPQFIRIIKNDIQNENSETPIEETIIFVFSKDNFQVNIYESANQSMLILKNDKSKTENISCVLKPVFEGDRYRDTTLKLYTNRFSIVKNFSGLFGTQNQNGDNNYTFECNRKTMPGSNSLRIYCKASENSIKINLTGENKIKLESCKLLYIKGTTSPTILSPEKGLEISSYQFVTHHLPELAVSLSRSEKFPLFKMIEPYLRLYSSTPFDPRYIGQVLVKYQLIDDMYPFFVFTDTINFAINIDEPVELSLGMQKKVLLDNAALIEYGIKLNPGKECTQEELNTLHQSKLKTILKIIIPLLILLFFLYFFFIRKNKRLTWKNIRTFYK